MKKYIDMHCHSKYSDGYYNVDELINIAKKNNVDFFSITDHDDINSTVDILNYSTDKEIKLINGIELSTVYLHNGEEKFIHLLGYDFDTKNVKLINELKRMKDVLIYNNRSFIDNINKHNIEIPECILENLYYSNYTWIENQIKKILIEYDYSLNYIEKYLNIVNRFIPNYDDYEIDIYKAIEIILDSGGIPVLAHPNRIKLNDDDLDDLIKKLSYYGLRGIESSYSYFTKNDFVKYSHIAKKYSLLESVGSDFHFFTSEKNVIIGNGIKENLLKSDCTLKQFILERNKL